MATIDDRIDAKYMLSVTLGLGLLLLAVQGYYCAVGDTKSAVPVLYVLSMFVIVIANISALVALNHSVRLTAYGFCLVVEGVIVFMTMASGESMLPPIVLVMLPICSMGVSYFVTTKQMLPFLALTVFVLLVLGMADGDVDVGIPSMAGSVVGSVLVSRLRTELYRLRGAIRILSKHGRQNAEIKERLRRITGDNA